MIFSCIMRFYVLLSWFSFFLDFECLSFDTFDRFLLTFLDLLDFSGYFLFLFLVDKNYFSDNVEDI